MTAVLTAPTSPVALPGLDTLAPITLAELTASAALLTRVDRKYVLDAADLPALVDRLPNDARVLEIDGSRSFAYRSLYLDTADLAAYRGAAHARRLRWKVRTRRYSTGAQFLEVKTRRSASTVKERIDWAGDGRLDARGRHFVETSLGAAGISLDAATLAPALATTYRRTTLFVPGSGARATLDVGLTWSRSDADGVRRFGDRVVLETKSGNAPSAVDRTLWRLVYRPVRLSKYAVGMAALDPALPHNRWHRIVAALPGW